MILASVQVKDLSYISIIHIKITKNKIAFQSVHDFHYSAIYDLIVTLFQMKHEQIGLNTHCLAGLKCKYAAMFCII